MSHQGYHGGLVVEEMSGSSRNFKALIKCGTKREFKE